MERMWMCFFSVSFFLQSSNAILCHCGDYSWTAVRDYSTWRIRRRSSPHKRRAMIFDSTVATLCLALGRWQRSSDSPTLWLWRAEPHPTVCPVLSMRSVFTFFLFNHGPNCPYQKLVSMQSSAGPHYMLINYTIAGRSTLFCPVTIFKAT